MAKQFTIEFEFRNQKWTDAQKGLAAFVSAVSGDWGRAEMALSREMKAFLDEVAKALETRHSTPWPKGTTEKTLSRRSGGLTQSIVESVRVEGNTLATMRGVIGSDKKYARIQETGGTVYPKKAKFLAIPLPSALDSRGLPKRSKPRDWPNTFVARSRKGNLLIFQRRGTLVIPLYVLKSSVYIPPRLGLRKTLDVGIPYFIERAMDQMVKSVVEGSKK